MENTKNKSRNKEQVIVSLTSFPAAISYAAGAVKSILEGSVLPDKIVLYLKFSQFSGTELPKELTELARENSIFEIRDYGTDIRSYLKLIPALNDFPEAVIVTIDDDQIYHKHLLRDLLKVRERFPEAIIAHRVKRIKKDVPYSKWKKYKWHHFLFKKYHIGFNNMQTGVGGVLYPPHSLKEEMLDESLFTKMAPTADDIWFWAAAVANGTKIIPVPFGVNAPHGIGKPPELSLMTFNYSSGTDRNIAYFNAILDYFPDIKCKLGF